MADDADLEAIRQRRMAQLMAQSGGGQGAPPTPEEQENKQAAQDAAEEKRRATLMRILDSDARERLTRISLVKPDKARAIEDMLLSAAFRGQITSKISEARLIDLLEQVNERSAGQSKITVQRRRGLDDDF